MNTASVWSLLEEAFDILGGYVRTDRASLIRANIERTAIKVWR